MPATPSPTTPQDTTPAQPTQAQETTNTPPATDPPQTPLSFLQEITQEAKPSADTIVDPQTGVKDIPAPAAPERPQMDEKEAADKTKRLMQFRDFIQSRLLAWGCGDMTRVDEMKLAKWEFEMLCDVYHDTIQRIGYIPAWLDILIAEAMVMTPKIIKLIDYRKLKATNERQAQIISSQQAQINQLSGKKKIRGDAKRYWEIDENGYFVNDVKGGYIKQGDRREKPVLTEESYQMLVKYNSQALVDKLFKIDSDA